MTGSIEQFSLMKEIVIYNLLKITVLSDRGSGSLKK